MTTTVASTREAIEEFFRRFGAGDRAGTLDLFADQVDFLVAGAETVPWTGRRSGKPAIEQFLVAATTKVDTEEFAVERIVVDGEHAVALGHFTHRVKRTGRSFSSRFALHVTVSDGKIRRYHMFEDSHAVAAAFSR